MPESETTIRAPWTPEQVAALNQFQQFGGMHPFTCGNERHDVHYVLIARTDGWHCSQPPCGYRQDWAHAFMANPRMWPLPQPFPRGVTVLESPDPAPGEPAPALSASGLRDQIAEVLRSTPVEGVTWEPGQEKWDHHKGPDTPGHTFMITCALCQSHSVALADAVLAVVQPAIDEARGDKAAGQRAIRNLMRSERKAVQRAEQAEAALAHALTALDELEMCPDEDCTGTHHIPALRAALTPLADQPDSGGAR